MKRFIVDVKNLEDLEWDCFDPERDGEAYGEDPSLADMKTHIEKVCRWVDVCEIPMVDAVEGADIFRPGHGLSESQLSRIADMYGQLLHELFGVYSNWEDMEDGIRMVLDFNDGFESKEERMLRSRVLCYDHAVPILEVPDIPKLNTVVVFPCRDSNGVEQPTLGMSMGYLNDGKLVVMFQGRKIPVRSWERFGE